jgi:site-specific recombinase XerD
MTALVPLIESLPTLVQAAGEPAQTRFWEFFVNNIRNPHTRRAYGRAIGEFLAWCEQRGLTSIIDIEPLHIGAYVEALTRSHSAPTAKQRLAAIRMLFDWLVTGQIIPTNPAASVRGPKHVVKVGKTPVLDPEEARTLLDSIDVTTAVGLRDRALIALMVYSFARVGAALAMKVEDVYVQNADFGCGCMRRAASAMKCPATTIWRLICTPILMAAAWRAIQRRTCFGRSGAARAS